MARPLMVSGLGSHHGFLTALAGLLPFQVEFNSLGCFSRSARPLPVRLRLRVLFSGERGIMWLHILRVQRN
jgi:hypothetical protein